MRHEQNKGKHQRRLTATTLTALAIGLFVIAGCGGTTEDTQTTSTSTTLPPTTTTTAAATDPVPPSTTTAPTGEPPVIHLAGYTTVYSQNGVVRVSGWLDRPAEVMVGNQPADVMDNAYDGISLFETELNLDPGSHAIGVTATDSQGVASTTILTVLVDPALEMELAQLQQVDLTARTLVADYVEFLTGDEATKAAREDGIIGESEEVPGGFYLRNGDPQLHTLTVGDPGIVTLQACYVEKGPCVVEQAVDIDTWIELQADPEIAELRFGWNWYGNEYSPYWLTLQDGIVVQIQEQYLP